MTARHRRALALLALFGAAPARGIAQVAPADSAALLSITRRLLDAITAGDSAVWAPQLSPRWFLSDEEGHHVTRAEFLSNLHPLPSGQSGVLRLAEWHLTGGPGVVVLSYDIEEQHNYYGQQLSTRFHTTDTWSKESGSWKQLASQVTALPTPIAGQPVARALLDEYAGSYALTPEIGLRIAASDSGLSLIRGSAPAQRLYALEQRIFIRHGVRGFWLFERDSSGAVTRLVNWRDNNAVVWRRVAAPH